MYVPRMIDSRLLLFLEPLAMLPRYQKIVADDLS